MQRIGLTFAFGATTVLFGPLEFPALAQQANCRTTPAINVYQAPGATEGISYISSHIRVSENAYLFVVEIDLNGQTEVLYPASPGGSFEVAADKPVSMPGFFSGFGGSMGPSQQGLRGAPTSRGIIFALASCAPFSFDGIVSDGEWNVEAIQSLIHQQSPQTAIAVLAKHLGKNGHQVGRGMMPFMQARMDCVCPRLSEPFLER
jgi:hypothetical protein